MAEVPSDPTLASPKSSGLPARLATAGVACPILIALILWPNPSGFLTLILIGVTVSLLEYYALIGADRFERGVGVVLGLAFAAAYYALDRREILYAGVVVVAFGLFLLRRGDAAPRALEMVSRTVLGTGYVGLLIFTAMLKRDCGPGWVILLLSLTWVGDAFAYGVGRLIGRHKLYPAVSPSKTWEGMVGGVLGSVAATVLAKMWYLPTLGWGDVFAVAVPAALCGQLGDFCESLLKRAYGAKDSGRLLPGHGGLLDRIDALLFAAPYVYVYATWMS